MKWRPRLPLYAKILLVFLANIGVLTVVLFAVMRHQFGSGFGSALGRLASDRVQSISEGIYVKLASTDQKTWTPYLKELGSTYGLKIAIVGAPPVTIVGHELSVPDAVVAEMEALRPARQRPGPGGGRRPPPGPNENRFPPDDGAFGALFEPVPPEHGPDGRPEPDGPPEELLPMRMGMFMKHLPDAHPSQWIGALLPPLRALNRPPGAPLFLMFAGDSATGNGLFFDLKPWLWGVFGALALSALMWFPLVRGITRTVRETMHATEAIAKGDFTVRVDDARGDELGRLGQAVNTMAVQLDGYVRGQKRFLGDIAHELCSPIARMEMGLGILEGQIQANQQERLADVRSEVRELSVMVGELLSFSKAALSREATPRQTVHLLDLMSATAEREDIPPEKLRLSIPREWSVVARPELLSRAVGNVLRNATRHAPESEIIEITARQKGQHVVLTIADRGPGVPEECVARLFEPFFRVDAARTRESGGTGLGLAIVKTCVESCGGTVEARNRDGGGLEVTMQLEAANEV
ncbi:MAG: HAMP domain-containing histidine kinase [Verrucomicrobiaceae bacterium]|nr:HAMP domain-containing histidine kinase [Verrucomicrobiaceae bacterium]